MIFFFDVKFIGISKGILISIINRIEMEADVKSIVGRESLGEINKMTPNSKVAALRKISEQMPNVPEQVFFPAIL